MVKVLIASPASQREHPSLRRSGAFSPEAGHKARHCILRQTALKVIAAMMASFANSTRIMC
jgi:hypothetical protein